MKSILIKDTTREEREQIVKQSLWGNCGAECEFCSGCDNRGGGRIEALYQPYIDGEKEIAEIKDTISLFSERLKILRKDINTCERIEKSEPDVESKIGKILEIEQQQKNKTQNRSRGYSRDVR